MVWPKSQLIQAIVMCWLFHALDKVQNKLKIISLEFVPSSDDYGVDSRSWTLILEFGAPNMILVGVPKWLGLLRLGIFLSLLMGVNLVVCPFLSTLQSFDCLFTHLLTYPPNVITTFLMKEISQCRPSKNFHLSTGERHVLPQVLKKAAYYTYRPIHFFSKRKVSLVSKW